MTGRTPLSCLVILTALAAVLIFGSTTASARVACSDTVENPCAALAISKSGPSIVRSGDTAAYTFYVWNPGYEPIAEISVTDDHCSPVSAPDGDYGEDGVLDPYNWDDEEWVFTCSYKIDADPGTYVDNVAHVVGTAPNDSQVSADSSPHRTWLEGLVITKDVDLTSADPYDVLHYTITVSNKSLEGGPSYYIPSGGIEDEGCTDLQEVTPTDSSSIWLDPGNSV